MPAAAAKAGVVNLTRDAAVELAADNITVNSICPGYIETPIQDYLNEEIIEECKKVTPLPRLGARRFFSGGGCMGKCCPFFKNHF